MVQYYYLIDNSSMIVISSSQDRKTLLSMRERITDGTLTTSIVTHEEYIDKIITYVIEKAIPATLKALRSK